MMTTLNRSIQPKYNLIDKIEITKAVTIPLSNGTPFHYINSGSQDVIRLDFIFNAGNWYADKPILAAATNSLMNEGTKNFNSFELAQKFDFYGAYISFSIDNDFATISVLTLNKNLSEILPVVEDMIKNSIYPEKELETFLRKQRQKFIVEGSKVKTIARRKFKEVIYGEGHPYANILEEADFEKITISDIKKFFSKVYGADNCKIVASGKINDKTINELEKHFGKNDWLLKTKPDTPKFEIHSNNIKENHIAKNGAVQSALRIGKPMINKLHEDYKGLQVVNTILGGYFGSRLMANIREDKGYTYGIGSVLLSMKNAGYFAVVSEVGADVTQKAINEIYYEIKRLRETPVPEKELQLVKSYILGEFVRMFDGPFSLLDSFKAILNYNLDYDYYNNFIETVKNIDSKEILRLSNKYLQQDSFYEVTVGKK